MEVANYVPLGVGVFCCFRVKETARDSGLEKGAAKVVKHPPWGSVVSGWLLNWWVLCQVRERQVDQ